MLLQALEIAYYCIADIGHRFVACRALGDTARQRRTFGDENAILVRLDRDAKFHGCSLSGTTLLAMFGCYRTPLSRTTVEYYRQLIAVPVACDLHAP
jgi:hypothetical protein